MTQHLMILMAAMLAGTAAQAQDWRFDLTSYLWFPETRTSIELPRGTATSELSASDALKNLDAGLMLSGTARRGPWTLVGDLLYMDVDGDGPTPFGVLFSGVAVETRLTALSGYALYNVIDDPHQRLDLGMGLRAMRSDVKLRLQPGLLPQEATRIRDDWVDTVLALRYSARLNDAWTAGVALDYGGFGIGSASDETWQAVATVGYALNDNWSLLAGYRHLHVDQESDGIPYKLKLSGPMLGVNWRF